MSDAAEPEVHVSRRGRLGVVELDRPKSINALTHPMVLTIRAALDAWEHDDEVATLLVVGRGERGLCAGGDIVSLYRDAVDGDGSASAAFWRDEYALNARLARYPKPIVAIMDGIVLGGGVGISAHCSHRVVTERSKVGMPETGIGFVPDVGGTWLLSRPQHGELGTLLGLSGVSVPAADAIEVGLADVFVPSDRLPALVSALETTDADAAIAVVAEHRPASQLAADRAWIDAAFAGDSVGGILDRLRADGREVAEVIAAKSPTALAVTLASLRRSRALESLERVLEQEYCVSLRMVAAPDFAEGVRAQVIDKDRSPRWNPASLAEVGSVDGYFEPVPNSLEISACTRTSS